MRVSTVIGIVIIGTAILVGVIITGSLQDVAEGMDLGVEGNETRDALLGNLWQSFNISALGVIVLAAFAIIFMRRSR